MSEKIFRMRGLLRSRKETGSEEKALDGSSVPEGGGASAEMSLPPAGEDAGGGEEEPESAEPELETVPSDPEAGFRTPLEDLYEHARDIMKQIQTGQKGLSNDLRARMLNEFLTCQIRFIAGVYVSLFLMEDYEDEDGVEEYEMEEYEDEDDEDGVEEYEMEEYEDEDEEDDE